MLQKSLPKGPSKGGRGAELAAVWAESALLICSGSFRAKGTPTPLEGTLVMAHPRLVWRVNQVHFSLWSWRGKPGKFSCLCCSFLIFNLWFYGGKKLWDWISFRNSALGLLIHFMYCPIWGEGLRLCVGDIIVGNVLLNYYLLKHHLGDTLSLTCSLILHAERGNSSTLH